jgi:Uma2 family endonuclease
MQQMATTTTPGRMTVHEWAALPEDEAGELCDGVLEEEEVAGVIHEIAVLWLGALFRTWVVALGGFACGSDVKYAL